MKNTIYVSPLLTVREIQESEPINDEIDQEQYEFEQSVEKDKQYARYN